jgi:thymidylate synthase (FAD)
MEVFGSDLTVVNAARVSFANESKELSERDKNLIVYLAKHGHISPFFHPQIRLRLKMPIFVAREWFRHTVGFARNEVSRR